MKEDYLLLLLGSSIDYFYSAENYPKEGDFSHGQNKGRSAGGPPLNVGCVAATKGVCVKGLDMLKENDESTDFLIDHLKKNGIDTSNILFDKDATNGEVVIIVTGNKRTMFVIDPKRKKYQVDEKMQELLNNATYIYSLMHIVNRCFDNWEPLKIAKEHGAKIVLDGSSQYEDASRAQMIYELADGLFINDTDYERLSRVSEGDPKTILLEKGAEFICLTRGEEGAEVYTREGCYHSDCCKVQVSDSTGAGDSFAGAFLAARLKKMNYQQAVAYGCANGAYCCTKFGGSAGACSDEQLRLFAKEHNFEI